MALVTFDPEDTHNPVSICEVTGARPQDFKKWMDRNWDYLPDPLFAIKISTKKVVVIWSGDDGRKVIEMYEGRRRVKNKN